LSLNFQKGMASAGILRRGYTADSDQRMSKEITTMFRRAQYAESTTGRAIARAPTPPPDYEEESAEQGGQSQRSYIYFPFPDAERALLLMYANQSRIERGKSPWILVAPSAAFLREIQKVGENSQMSVLQLRSLFPAVPSLAGQTVDKVYIDGHGEPGRPYFYKPEGDRLAVGTVADNLVRRLHLSENVEVRLTACWGASASEIMFPQAALNARSVPNRMRDIYAFIEARYGDFSQTLAGQLEQQLIGLQPNRRRGLVSGYVGKITTGANNNEKWRATHDGYGELVSEHAQAAFPIQNSSGLLSVRRSDMRRSAKTFGVR
jgi:hypothetical protein